MAHRGAVSHETTLSAGLPHDRGQPRPGRAHGGPAVALLRGLRATGPAVRGRWRNHSRACARRECAGCGATAGDRPAGGASGRGFGAVQPHQRAIGRRRSAAPRSKSQRLDANGCRARGFDPAAGRPTRRLERLQRGVESLGAGDLTARVKVEGRDEVARLARSFNQAAARIEGLVNAHKMLLANASHELRTPLARIRLGLELVATHPERKVELERDIAELDQLVDEILLVSRLDATEQLDVREDVDLSALAAEECARYDDCSVEAKPVMVRGDPMLL